jgi:UDP-N-acetylglucosamine 2-epimerase (non-hydrolysing)
MKIVSIVGARPNLMKIAPFCRAIESHKAKRRSPPVEHLLVHTGQHYDDRMSRTFFDALGIPEADINLGIGSGSHAEQVGRTMMAIEPVLRAHRPDWVVVVGDVNATCACAITAKKEQMKLAHIEAGLRSGDMRMPEEVNRLVTDRLADLLFTPDELSSQNPRKEGIEEARIKFVGNIMIDTLEAHRERAAALSLPDIITGNLLDGQALAMPPRLDPSSYAVLTLHRPSNVDNPEVLAPFVGFLTDEVASDMPVIWPMHPRTQKQLADFGLWDRVRRCQGLVLLQPLGYHDMLRLNMDARIMMTDSGGLQEECCVLGTPCLTLRENTERPVTLREHGGACVLVGNNVARIRSAYQAALTGNRLPQRPALWDGKTAPRIVEALVAAWGFPDPVGSPPSGY